ncbi:MAG: FtsX-like permease family protein [Terriglobia bacterium]
MSGFRLFFRLFLRPLVREPLRASLTVIAVSLGVAVVLAIELAGNAAAGSFLSSVQALAGKADFVATGVGGVSGSAVQRLATLPYPIHVEPQVADYVTLMATGRVVPLLGIDMIAEASHLSIGMANLRWLNNDRCVWVSKGIAATPQSTISLGINDHVADFKVCGVLPQGNEAGADTVVMDIGLAAQQLKRGERVDRVLITIPQGKRSAKQWLAILRSVLPAGVQLEARGAEARENRRMLEAFQWNLRVLSYIALIVGAFLIYNSLSVSVVRRRTEIGVLRALGADQKLILAGFLGEAALYGIAGSALGLLLGRLMAQGAVGLIASTVQSLYLTSRPAPVSLSLFTVLLAFGIGITVALLSALLPALEASRVPPVEAMARARREYLARVNKRRDLALAGGCAVAAAWASRLPPVGGKPLFGYLAALLLVAASVLAIPALVSGVAAVAAKLPRQGRLAEIYLAVQSLCGSLRRTAVLLAALSTAISMVVSVAIMVGSFRKTVEVWLNQELQADIYVRPAVPAAVDRYPTMGTEVARQIAALPQVAAVDQYRAYPISYQGLPATLAGAGIKIAFDYGQFPLLPGEDRQKVMQQILEGRAVLVSEPFAVRRNLHIGERLILKLPPAPVSFRVAGIYHDYSDPRGVIVMDRSTLLKYLPDRAASSLGVYLKPGISSEKARRAVERACAGLRVAVISHSELRREAMAVFDRTFRITYALEAVALCVAVTGVGGALIALVVDRRREIALLRFLGSSARQIRRLIFAEAALLGLLAGLVGFVLGVCLSLILIFVINKQSFGWSIQFHWPVTALAGALLIIYACTLAAGIYPARLGMALNPIEAIQEE